MDGAEHLVVPVALPFRPFNFCLLTFDFYSGFGSGCTFAFSGS
jgi:hypothetical protein